MKKKRGNKKHKLKEQKNTLHAIEMLHKARNNAIKFLDLQWNLKQNVKQPKEQDLKY